MIHDHLTSNQAIVLLEVYRGTFKRDGDHPGTVEIDLEKLIRGGLITTGPIRMLPRGEDRVKDMLG